MANKEAKLKDQLICPHCGKSVKTYRNPFPTVDIIIQMPLGASDERTGSADCRNQHASAGIVLIKRKNPPFGWALPGGFVDYGEPLESAAVREAAEETSLKVSLLCQLGAYSDPSRDPRHHTLSVVFVARGTGVPKAADDATDIGVFDQASLPRPLAFDHEKILQDYFEKWFPEK